MRCLRRLPPSLVPGERGGEGRGGRLICPLTGVALGSFGDETSALRAAARILDDMALDPECDYFVCPDVMHALLQAIQAAGRA